MEFTEGGFYKVLRCHRWLSSHGKLPSFLESSRPNPLSPVTLLQWEPWFPVRPLAPWPQRSLLILRSESRCCKQKVPVGRCGFPTLVICTLRTNPTLSESHHFWGVDFRSTGDEKFSLKWKSACVFYDFMTQCGHPWVWYEGCWKIFYVSSLEDVSQVVQLCHQDHLPPSVWYPL